MTRGFLNKIEPKLLDMIVYEKLSGRKTIFSLLLMVSFTHCKEPVEPEQSFRSLLVEYKPINNINDILDIHDSLVAPVIYRGSINLDSFPIVVKKQKFINMMLPSILYAKYKMEQVKNRVDEIASNQALGLPVTEEEEDFLSEQLIAYKAVDIGDLSEKLLTHPVSIVLAQAAIESGWGTSRFFLEGNNVFGVWSYRADENRMKASQSREGRAIYVRKYDHFTGSIQDYFNTIARSKAYKNFRKMRTETDDAYALIPLLNRYSETGPAYVMQLHHIIRTNDLTRYDRYQLDPSYFVETEDPGFLVASLN